MADGDGQGIGCIVGLRNLGQAKLKPDHFLYLLFAARPVIGNPLLYLGWGIFIGWDSLISGCRIAIA